MRRLQAGRSMLKGTLKTNQNNRRVRTVAGEKRGKKPDSKNVFKCDSIAYKNSIFSIYFKSIIMYLKTITVKFYDFSERFPRESRDGRNYCGSSISNVWAMTDVSYGVLFGDTRAIIKLKRVNGEKSALNINFNFSLLFRLTRL